METKQTVHLITIIRYLGLMFGSSLGFMTCKLNLTWFLSFTYEDTCFSELDARLLGQFLLVSSTLLRKQIWPLGLRALSIYTISPKHFSVAFFSSWISASETRISFHLKLDIFTSLTDIFVSTKYCAKTRVKQWTSGMNNSNHCGIYIHTLGKLNNKVPSSRWNDYQV